MRTFKVIVIGDTNVGKTCLTFRFCNGSFPQTAATIGVDFRERKLSIGGEDIVLQLWDTAGQERFRRSMVQHYYRNVHAVVLVYDVTRTSSFQSLRSWLVECDRQGLSDAIPRLMIGNKCDETDNIKVSTSTAQCFADLHNMPLFETSAKADSECDHIESIFMTLAHKLQASRPLMSAEVNSAGGGAALEAIHRAETTAALQESGLIDVRSGDWINDPGFTERQESYCC
ncbi:putative Ras-related protein Rab-33 [Hyalella azteca]|uniref:Ras-related protein Rab-33 n=1 Tax=Hyalella azteca TaxID=294128 RepID=A0A8B7PLZ0_HYAAZ|nr:putative Ras-related protein Rab-33 [Hyalella azteca]